MLDRIDIVSAAPQGAASQQTQPVVTLRSLATATPPHRLAQTDVRDASRALFADRMPFFSRLEPVFDNAEIEHRYSCQPLEWFMQPADFKEKSRLYVEHATALAEDAARRALDAAAMEADEIDLILFVSSTGIATPSIDARLLNRIPFRSNVMRLPVFGYGCAGGVLGLSRAAQMARTNPGLNVLLIVVELCSLAFRLDRLTKSNLVACALFGDGAAAAVISGGADAGGAACTIGAGGEHCWPETLNVMGWDVDAGGLDVIFHQSIPDIVARDYPVVLDRFLAYCGLTRATAGRPCCHPGGAKVITELERVFGLPAAGLESERRVLRDFGNMSAPTVLFVLDDLLRSGASGPMLLTALGPGFTAAFQCIDVAAQGARP